ncbi:MAG: SRPBCC family protein [Nocardioidaceae bacterium]|nr:SRPBCC family protein [Nocardioidaceae bacterium]
MRWTNTLEIDTPIDLLWQVTMDVDALPSMTPTMSAVERLTPGELRPGSRVRIKQPAQPARVWTVTTADAPHRFVWQTKVGPATMVATHELTETERGTRNMLTLELTGPGSGLLGRLISGKITETLTTENAGFKRTAESLKS